MSAEQVCPCFPLYELSAFRDLCLNQTKVRMVAPFGPDFESSSIIFLGLRDVLCCLFKDPGPEMLLVRRLSASDAAWISQIEQRFASNCEGGGLQGRAGEAAGKKKVLLNANAQTPANTRYQLLRLWANHCREGDRLMRGVLPRLRQTLQVIDRGSSGDDVTPNVQAERLPARWRGGA